MIDINKIRKDFPMLNGKTMQGNRLVFLDNASTTFKPEAVINAMNDYYCEFTSNSHRGDYDLCYNLDVKIDEARQTIATFINSDKNEVVFTSGDTESLNLIAYGYALKFLTENDAILISEIDHASNALPWFKIAKLTGCKILMMETKNGKISVDLIEKSLKNNKNIKLISVAQVSNVLGYKADIKAIAKVAHKYGALLAVDGAQSVPHMKVDFKDSDIDFLAFSAHKMCGPTGVGALVCKSEILNNMDTFQLGGGMNGVFNNDATFTELPAPQKFEAGTLNISGILGFKAAADYLMNIGMDNIEQYEKELHAYAISKLENLSDIIIYNKECDGSIITFNRKGVFAQDEATLLNYKGIAVRSGEHCAKMLHNIIKEKATVRMSAYFYTSKEEIDIFVDALANGGDILDAYFK